MLFFPLVIRPALMLGAGIGEKPNGAIGRHVKLWDNIHRAHRPTDVKTGRKRPIPRS
jgi:hypothetical protein